MSRRLLISGGGTGASNNLIRSLRAADPSLSFSALHTDRFYVGVAFKKTGLDRLQGYLGGTKGP